ncbi:hypothetical protein TNCV_4576501 [Trichonephila clavipes]|nr:hypothetical protein TNCV_4576501 [Trichonephila clavipes]
MMMTLMSIVKPHEQKIRIRNNKQKKSTNCNAEISYIQKNHPKLNRFISKDERFSSKYLEKVHRVLLTVPPTGVDAEERFRQQKYGKFIEDCIPDGVFRIGDDVFVFASTYYDSVSVHIRRFKKYGKTYYPTPEGITLDPRWIEYIMRKRKYRNHTGGITPSGLFPPERHIQITMTCSTNGRGFPGQWAGELSTSLRWEEQGGVRSVTGEELSIILARVV